MVVIAGTSADDYRGEEQDCNFFSDGFHQVGIVNLL
jgi:hypothetical protein